MTSQRVTVEYEDDTFRCGDGRFSLDLGWYESGLTPVTALLMATGACSLMDVVVILRKRKVEHRVLRVEVEAERAKDPNRLTRFHLRFVSDAPVNEMERAVRLSLDRYCTVVNTLRGVAEVTHEIVRTGSDVQRQTG